MKCTNIDMEFAHLWVKLAASVLSINKVILVCSHFGLQDHNE